MSNPPLPSAAGTQYLVPTGDDDLDAVVRIASEAFGSPADLLPRYFDQVGRENLRILKHHDRVVACLALIPSGHFFGGRSVPAVGVALVATAAHTRGAGHATTLLHAMLREQRAAGRAVSSLYPATVRLYRRAGYELAGIACEAELPVPSIDCRSRALPIRPLADADQPAVRSLHRAWAASHPGALDRSEFHWKRVAVFRGEKTRGYVAERNGSIEGYLFLRDVSTAVPWAPELVIQDIAYSTPDAAAALLTFIADHRTTRRHVRFRTGPTEPLLMLLGEIPYKLAHKLPWMLRILDVPAALAARGYADGLHAELHLDVRDESLPEAAGRFVLRVANGRGGVEPGGRGELVTDARGLAPLYTGHLSPADLLLAGALSATQSALAAATSIFAGPQPWIRDEF